MPLHRCWRRQAWARRSWRWLTSTPARLVRACRPIHSPPVFVALTALLHTGRREVLQGTLECHSCHTAGKVSSSRLIVPPHLTVHRMEMCCRTRWSARRCVFEREGWKAVHRASGRQGRRNNLHSTEGHAPQHDALWPTPCSPLPLPPSPLPLQGKRTVPQIFINGAFIGGAEELDQLASSGQLAQRLG